MDAPSSPSHPLPARIRALALLVSLGALHACSGGGDGSGNGTGGNGGGGTRRGGSGNNLSVTPAFLVTNESAQARNETILASVPFPKGLVRDLSTIGVRGLGTAWRVLQRWPDQSVRVAQAQILDPLNPQETRRYEVVRDVQALTDPFQRNTWVGAVLPNTSLFSVVTDTNGVQYTATMAGTPTTLEETFFTRTTRYRLYHRNASNAGIGRDFLTATMYLTEFRDQPLAWLDLVVGNDYLGADSPGGSSDPNLYPLGPVSFSKVEVGFRNVGMIPAFQSKNGIGQSYGDGQGNQRYQLLPAGFLTDGATKRWRLFLYFDYINGVQGDRDRWAVNFQSMAAQPLRTLATKDCWQATGALGLLGGPVDGPSNSLTLVNSELLGWRNNTGIFGPFGAWGDTKYSNTTGTPRNGPMSPELGHAVQAEQPLMVEKLEGMAWQQAVRPYHLWDLRVGAEDGLYLWDGVPFVRGGRRLSTETLGRFALYQNDPYTAYRTTVNWGDLGQGWNQYDHEHWTTDLLFDYWTVTGDHWAQAELANLGQCLKGVMRLRTFFTAGIQAARAEGWCMVGFVQSYLATQDDSLKTYALRRVHEVVDVQRRKSHPSRALVFQANYPGTGFPTNNEFYMPWQHAAVIYGYLAAYRFFEDDTCLTISEDCVTAVDYGWVRNAQDPRYGLVPNGLRYYVPVSYNGAPCAPEVFDSTVGIKWGDSPLGGAHEFLISALYCLARETPRQSVNIMAVGYADLLLGGPSWRSRPSQAWNKWTLGIPNDMLP